LFGDLIYFDVLYGSKICISSLFFILFGSSCLIKPALCTEMIVGSLMNALFFFCWSLGLDKSSTRKCFPSLFREKCVGFVGKCKVNKEVDL